MTEDLGSTRADGCIRIKAPAGSRNRWVEFGVVWIWQTQAAAARQHGWVIAGDDGVKPYPYLVKAVRSEPGASAFERMPVTRPD